MKTFIRVTLILGTLVGAGVAAYQPVSGYLQERSRPKFRTAQMEQGDIVAEVDATGEVKPILSVIVGSVVSGPIATLQVDFNDRVHKGDLMAKIDTRLYDAAVAQDTALLKTAEAEVQRVQATLEQARRDENRGLKLQERNPDFISQAELDQLKYNRLALEAQLTVAEAAITQAEASLQNSKTNLDYTRIVAPVDGIVIDKMIDAGQTLAAQFQAPELFKVAVDLDKVVHVYASVDETEIGLVQQAREASRPVYFTVDAHPEDLFVGTIEQIRMSSTETQGVITYPVIVSAPNPDLKLLPGMTAKISFEVDQVEDVLKIPSGALRYYPRREHVREEDRKLLDGVEERATEEEDQRTRDDAQLTAREKVEAQKSRRRRHVWVQEGQFLRAVEVVTGLSDNRYYELVEGDLKAGQEVVIGLKVAE
jgi:HlyD family secretion protein